MGTVRYWSAVRYLLVGFFLSGFLGKGHCQDVIGFQCFDETSCGGNELAISASDADSQFRECCLSDSGVSYRTAGICMDCVVYGFFDDKISESELGLPYEFCVGYLKGSGPTLRANVVPAEGSAHEGTDFSLSINRVIIRPGINDTVSVTFRVDSIAQEIVETATLKLEPTTNNLPVNAIFRDEIQLEIIDSDVVIFQLTENDYRSNEVELKINAVVSKNVRLANDVTFTLTPFNVSEANASGQPMPTSIPDDKNKLSPNGAKSYPSDRRDFSPEVLTVVFIADENTNQTNDVQSPVSIFDDEINEALEEVFIVVLDIVSSVNPAKINIVRRASLCRIIDDDDIRIGFQNSSYTFAEPRFETEISGEVFLEKENGRISEQTFSIFIEVTPSTPDRNIQPALLSTSDASNDYILTGLGVNFFVLSFLPNKQTLEFIFTLLPDKVPEGTEAFQASAAQSRVSGGPPFTSPNKLFSSTFINIIDDDPVIIGFEQTNYTVSESDGSFEVCFKVIIPTDDQLLTFSIDLVVDTVEGTAGSLDFTAIKSDNLDVFETLNQNSRRACFNVQITSDQVYEDFETFSLQLNLDQFVNPGIRDNVIIEPSEVDITIEDATTLMIGFINDPYSGLENGGSIQFTVGVLGNTTLDRDVVIDFSTVDGTVAGSAALAGSDYVAISGSPLTFNAQTRVIPINVTLFDDGVFELTESFSGSLGSGIPRLTLSPNSAQAIITDDDVLIIGYKPDTYSFGEGSSTNQVMAALTGNPGQFIVTVDYKTDELGTATAGLDYDDVSDSLSFTSSQSLTSHSVNLKLDDLAEGNETFGVSLSNPSISLGGVTRTLIVQESGRISLQPDSATITIIDDDFATVGFSQTVYQVDEGDPMVVFMFGVLDGNLTVAVNFDFTTLNGTALAGSDYTGSSSSFVITGQAQFQAPVSIMDDNDYESSESFQALLTEGAGFPSFVILNPSLAEATVNDNDAVIIGWEFTSYDVTEGGDSIARLCAIVSGAELTFDLPPIEISAEDGSAKSSASAGVLQDYIGEPSTNSFVFGPSTARRMCTTFGISDNEVFEQSVEDFFVSLNLSSEVDRVSISPARAQVNILDTDVVTIGFNETDYTFPENIEEGSLMVGVLMGILETDVVVSLSTANNSALAPADYMTLSDVLLTFSGSNSQQSPKVAIVDDNIDEEDLENFLASLALVTDNNRVTINPSSASVSISDNDVVQIGFERVTYNAVENDTVEVCAIITANSPVLDREVKVIISSMDGSAEAPEDYEKFSKELTFGPAVDRQCIMVNVNKDNIVEGEEEFTVSLNTTDGNVDLEPDTAIITIDETMFIRVMFEQPEYEFTESGITGRVTVIKDKTSDNAFQVRVVGGPSTQENIVRSADGIDQIQTFEAGPEAPNSLIFEFSITDDSVGLEAVETYLVDLTLVGSPEAVMLGSLVQTRVSVLDDDDTGMQVNDTAIGDPLMTVPLLVSDEDLQKLNSSKISLCYEIHGVKNQYFNLITDECASVNAHYSDFFTNLNVIQQIAVRATDNNGLCTNILVDVDGCTASVNGVMLSGSPYASSGISVRKYPNRVRISVPNCNELSLIMWVFCETRSLDNPSMPGVKVTGDMIKFVVMRGLNFGHRRAHGLIGQFWNVPARIEQFTGLDVKGNPQPQRYVVSIKNPNSASARNFTGWYYHLTWSSEEGPCLYAGNRQGGKIAEVANPNDAVIEGVFRNYMVDSAFSESDYAFGLFNEGRCVAVTDNGGDGLN